MLVTGIGVVTLVDTSGIQVDAHGGTIFKPDPYHPFPPDVRADGHGGYYEWDIGQAFRFAVVTAIRFLDERARDLIDRTGTTIAEWYPELTVLGRAPRDDTIWLYRLEVFTVDKRFTDDAVSAADHARDFQAHIFDSFDDLVLICAEKYCIRLEDLVFREETSYPSD
ncbi:MAG: hypothetical protein K0R33_4550 [Mycobacterium sp.]|nr:hypothetical protein [Mycobacterium sp.]